MACLFQKIVSFDKESYFCIETINIKLSFHSMNFVEELKMARNGTHHDAGNRRTF